MRGKRVLKRYCLATVLKRLLSENNMGVPELSAKTGYPKSTLYGWLAGHKPDSPEDVVDLAAFFGLHRDDLEFGTSTDRSKQAEIDKLKELLKTEKELADRKQLDFLWLQSEFKEVQEELDKIKNKAS